MLSPQIYISATIRTWCCDKEFATSDGTDCHSHGLLCSALEHEKANAPGQFLSTNLDDMQIQPIDSVIGAIVRITEKQINFEQLTKGHTVFSTDH
ncbi:hypothetical protein LSAT2_013604 [Lamellibrachia satsuma]|nr:hypothetical protein LSAT2_013604 [Lamellibrachia satsuma]